MKLLYVDCGHPYQAADHCLIWHDLGIDWRATGYYCKNNGSGDLPKIKSFTKDEKFINELELCKKSEYHGGSIATEINVQKNKTFASTSINNQWTFTKELIDQFDVIFFNHFISNIINNLSVLKNKIVIFNTFGMHNPKDEQKIGILRASKTLIRVSNNEYESLRTPLYGGHDAIIHGSVIPNEKVINNWTGKTYHICTFSSGFNKNFPAERLRRKNYLEIKNLCPNYDFLLYGACNEDEPLSCGFINMAEKIKIMQDCRVHLVTGTPGSSCTYSLVESMIMGAPVVCYGKDMWQSKSYEASKIFNHGENILIGETPDECADYINLLMNDINLCQTLSQNARKAAIKYYGRKVVADMWRNLFNNYGLKC